MLGSGVLCLALLPCQHVGNVVTGSKKGGSKPCSSFSHRALRAQRGTTASRVCWGHWCEAARVAASVTMLETRRWSCRTLCSTHCPGCRGVAGAALLAPSPTRHPTAEASLLGLLESKPWLWLEQGAGVGDRDCSMGPSTGHWRGQGAKVCFVAVRGCLD